jgi:alpha-D-ribose 1-methylphosphonate 5-triphosphate synthase subunit PhnI
MLNNPDPEMDELYNRQLEFAAMMMEQHGPMAVAAIMMTQALSIYRTTLEEIDYHNMVDTISQNRNQIKKFTPDILP